MKASGGSVFPFVDHTEVGGEYDEKEVYFMGSCGMTLRDHFAGDALMGELSGGVLPKDKKEAAPLAHLCYMLADAMIAERSKD